MLFVFGLAFSMRAKIFARHNLSAECPVFGVLNVRNNREWDIHRVGTYTALPVLGKEAPRSLPAGLWLDNSWDGSILYGEIANGAKSLKKPIESYCGCVHVPEVSSFLPYF